MATRQPVQRRDDEPAFGKPEDAPGGQGPDDDGKSADDVPPIGDGPVPPTSSPDSGADKMQDLVDKAQQMLLEGIVKGLGDKLAPKPEDVPAVSPSFADADLNDTLITGSTLRSVKASDVVRVFAGNDKAVRFFAATRTAILAGRVSALAPRDLIIFSWMHDTVRSAAMPAPLYQAAMSTGPSSDFPSERSYVAACGVRVGRRLTADEQKFFVRIGRIASAPLNV